MSFKGKQNLEGRPKVKDTIAEILDDNLFKTKIDKNRYEYYR